MLKRINNVEYVSDYRLKLLFSDDKTKIVDFEDWINEETVYLRPLKNIQYFKKVKMDEFNFSICWPNGANFSPDVLYEKGSEVNIRAKNDLPKRRAKTSSVSTKSRKTIKR